MRLSVYVKIPAGMLTLGAALLLASARAQSPGAPPGEVPGQTATLLSDGRWLLIGGQGPHGPLSSVAVQDPRTGNTTAMAPLREPRIGHTATMLPEGEILVLGGFGRDGLHVTTLERYDPVSQTSRPMSSAGLTPRAYHSATLLTDGRVLVAGGVSQDGRALDLAQLLEPPTFAVESVGVPLTTPRRGAAATLLSDGRVLIWGGADAGGAALTTGELFDPEGPGFERLDAPPAGPDPTDTPKLEASIPGAGGVDVPTDSVLTLRFSKPLRVDAATGATVTLTGATGLEPVRVVAAEAGRLAFVSPRLPLTPGTTYTLTVDGAVDVTGLVVPITSVTFQTADGPTGGDGRERAGGAPTAAGHFHPAGAVTPGKPGETDDWEWHGPLCDGRPCSRWQKLPPLAAKRGVTALAGQMLRLNGEPLAGATLRIGNRSVRTDQTGRFLLAHIPAGDQVLVMDGSTANQPGRSYGIFEYYVDIEARETTALPFTIWMPLLDTRNATAIPVPTTRQMVATTPLIPGLEVRIPRNVILQTSGGPLRSMPLTRIPVDRPPFPLPPGSTFSFTPQAHGALVQRPDGRPNPAGVRIILPNIDRLPAGTRVGLQGYEPAEGWVVYGQGVVSPDGTQIVPDPGVEFHRVTCFFPLGNLANFKFDAAIPGGVRSGEPVDLATGIFTMEKVDLALPDVIPIVVRREYRQNDTVVRGGEYGAGQSFFYQMMLVGDFTTFGFAELVLANGGRIHYRRTSPGTDKIGAVMEHSGTASAPATPTGFYASVLRWNAARQGWDIAFPDGTIYQFAAAGHLGTPLTGIQDRVGNQLTVSRGGIYGELITRITSPNGRWVDFVNGVSGGPVTQIRDNLGRTVSYTYDAQSRLTTVTDAGGGVTRYTYHPQGGLYALIHTITDARNITYLTNAWDLSKRRVVSQTQADGTIFQFAYSVDGQGKITQTDMTDPRGGVRRVTFNGAGYPLTDTKAFGTDLAQATSYVRDGASNLATSVTDGLGRRTDLSYDTKGNPLTLTRLAGTGQAVTTTYTYEPGFSQMTSVTDPLNHTTTLTYDSAGNLTTITNPLGHSVTLTYAASGQPLTITTPAGTTGLGYDRGDVATITDALGNTITRFTDGGGRLTSLTDTLGRRTRFDYDALNQLRNVTDSMGGQTKLTYDPNGNLLSLTDARNSVTTYAYDTMDRVATRTDPLFRAESYVSDGNGNLTAVTDRKGQRTSRAYDLLDRLTQVSYEDGSTTAFAWDAGNRLIRVVDSDAGSIIRDYDLLDRLIEEVTPQGTVTYTYDPAGRRTGLSVPGQPTLSYTYDAADRLIRMTQGAAIVSLAYDPADRRTSLSLPNGVSTEYTWDAASRLTGLTYKNGPNVLGTLTYEFDAGGNRTLLSGTWARTALPPALTAATYDAANQQVVFNGQALTYDLNGNLTQDGATTYTWDARDRLIALTGPGVTASFSYDPLGRRISKTIDGAETSFLYERANPVQEQQGGLPVANLLTGPGVDEYLARADATGLQHFLTDALGSTIALTGADGTVPTSYTYDPFGHTTLTGAATTNSFGYTGRESDGTGLLYYRARYYHARLQRFLSEDPVGFHGGLNLYAYAWNNPLRWVDPFGLYVTISKWKCCVGFDHVGIAVNSRDTKGFYPEHPGRIFDRGVVVDDVPRIGESAFKESFTIDTTPEQDIRIQAFIEYRRDNPGTYNVLTGRHCGGFVQAALRAGGISPFGDVAGPGSFFDALKALNNGGVDFRHASPRSAP